MNITTPRLTLRRFTPDDFELLVRLHANPDVMQYAGGVKSRGQTQDIMDVRILQYYERYPGLGIWATIERSTGICCGTHLLNHIRGESMIQLGYLLFPEFWGRGYATEMSIAVLRYGFTQMQLPRIHALTDQENVPSQQVLVKAGLRRQADRTFADPSYQGRPPFAFFERSAEEWLAEDRVLRPSISS
jgi:RimJ/RimL family protein N-acetyltransferase